MTAHVTNSRELRAIVRWKDLLFMAHDNMPSKVALLEARIAANWPAIRKARLDTSDRRQRLNDLFLPRNSPDTSLVVFGSVARQEVTSGSDLDWILLIDGQSTPEHKEQERAIESTLASQKYTEPGKSGVFGRMVGSHDLVHNIGGEDDLNSNTTRRVLLLLESLSIGNREAYDRVRKQILRRYLEDDRGIRYSSGQTRIPRFLLNDLTRYWRTVTVDFVYKQRAENDKKWALRNAKLRMSRKLVFAAGLLQCFFCHLDAAADPARQALKVTEPDVSPLTAYIEHQLSFTPLEVVAKACLEQSIKPATARAIFDNYDRFLTILDDAEKRSELEQARTHADLRKSEAWKEVREVSSPFHEGLVRLFLDDDEDLKQLTMKYGVF
ncbi:MAG TPA: nucleotidyltransferase domain-containing protein [Bryobacteraceae bacterium]|nr:nucleotidyltransferase domain-containing protein [Bryobacteraceae bacterium]